MTPAVTIFRLQVTGHSGIWLGIDWDDAARGKHDGSVNGITYFCTRFAQLNKKLKV